jgi:hypothetical protein
MGRADALRKFTQTQSHPVCAAADPLVTLVRPVRPVALWVLAFLANPAQDGHASITHAISQSRIRVKRYEIPLRTHHRLLPPRRRSRDEPISVIARQVRVELTAIEGDVDGCSAPATQQSCSLGEPLRRADFECQVPRARGFIPGVVAKLRGANGGGRAVLAGPRFAERKPPCPADAGSTHDVGQIHNGGLGRSSAAPDFAESSAAS